MSFLSLYFLSYPFVLNASPSQWILKGNHLNLIYEWIQFKHLIRFSPKFS